MFISILHFVTPETLMGLYGIGLGFLTLMMKNWWSEKLIRMQNENNNETFSSFFRANYKNKNIKQIKNEINFTAFSFFAMGIIAIFFL